ncbi:MAG: DKNYY domain-containing protein [bacterium]|nr:DKNYY domain-containing protein [bacterium]
MLWSTKLAFLFLLFLHTATLGLIGAPSINQSENAAATSTVNAEQRSSESTGRLKIVTGIPSGLTKVDDVFSKDDTNVYLISDNTYSAKVEDPVLDAPSFKLIVWDYGYDPHFYEDKNDIYMESITWSGSVDGLIPLHADRATYRYLGGNFGRDDTSVYYCNSPIRGADVHTFTVIAQEGTIAVAKDANAVFAVLSIGSACGKVEKVIGADPTTFTVSRYVRYAVDSKHVYWLGLAPDASSSDGPLTYQIIPGADPKPFTIIKGVYHTYGKDEAYVYLDGEIVPGADPKTFDPAEEVRMQESAYKKAHSWFAKQMGVATSDVFDTQIHRQSWPDSCMGMAGEGDVCTPGTAFGYQIIFKIKGQEQYRYKVHTNLDATVIGTLGATSK